MVAKLLEHLRRLGLSVATAESCTGGNIAHRITMVPGASESYFGSVVSYTNEVKSSLLGVPVETLRLCGAVSEPTVRAMVKGVVKAIGTDCAMATSGIAGPGGGTPQKPVGTVWIAARTPWREIARCHHFIGDRQAVISQATDAAIALLLEILPD
ncbi:MAG: CinA family protein [Muribaculaceae bacterium]|nr:CinA family protein [Muribaculaceae bacterium]